MYYLKMLPAAGVALDVRFTLLRRMVLQADKTQSMLGYHLHPVRIGRPSQLVASVDGVANFLGIRVERTLGKLLLPGLSFLRQR